MGNSPGPKIRKGGAMGCSGPQNSKMGNSPEIKFKNKMASLGPDSKKGKSPGQEFGKNTIWHRWAFLKEDGALRWRAPPDWAFD